MIVFFLFIVISDTNEVDQITKKTKTINHLDLWSDKINSLNIICYVKKCIRIKIGIIS